MPGRVDLAFVEYEQPSQAQMAKSTLGGFGLPGGKDMKVEYARK